MTQNQCVSSLLLRIETLIFYEYSSRINFFIKVYDFSVKYVSYIETEIVS
jgi:hypothetical protein